MSICGIIFSTTEASWWVYEAPFSVDAAPAADVVTSADELEGVVPASCTRLRSLSFSFATFSSDLVWHDQRDINRRRSGILTHGQAAV